MTLVELLPHIAPFEDEDVSEALAGYLQAEGLRIVTGFETQGVEKHGGRYRLTGIRNEEDVVLEAAQLLVATGRRPNTANMGLEEAGVRLGGRGEVLLNDRLQTENPAVYAAGDVLGEDMFVYVAAYGGIMAAENATCRRMAGSPMKLPAHSKTAAKAPTPSSTICASFCQMPIADLSGADQGLEAVSSACFSSLATGSPLSSESVNTEPVTE